MGGPEADGDGSSGPDGQPLDGALVARAARAVPTLRVGAGGDYLAKQRAALRAAVPGLGDAELAAAIERDALEFVCFWLNSIKVRDRERCRVA